MGKCHHDMKGGSQPGDAGGDNEICNFLWSGAGGSGQGTADMSLRTFEKIVSVRIK